MSKQYTVLSFIWNGFSRSQDWFRIKFPLQDTALNNKYVVRFVCWNQSAFLTKSPRRLIYIEYFLLYR